MKLLVTICLCLTSFPAISAAQQLGTQARLTRGQTKEAELALSDMGYWTGPVDGVFDAASRSALIAFQKWEKRPATGNLTIEELAALRAGSSPQGRETGYAHVEVDLDRQVLMLVNDDGSARILPVSTGNDKFFEAEGQPSIAYTPRGRFMVYDKEAGWGTGPLGAMYYSNFISGGVAIHGSPSVPTAPASHGCIRVPMFAARKLSQLMPRGTIVLVYDKVSFVSARDWAMNPKLKEAALSNISATFGDADDITPTLPGKNKRSRARIVRS
ncbi:MAG TPA: L,D-transpeptidase family protein [Pyrinomonadaceae bacterium]|nr:L,D-transpeptidase family protein [Pyrinomonadaceae bacterium]